jgi:uncharacterized DUF497 family protein
MKVESFDWDDANVDHAGRHQVDPDEAEEVFESRYYPLKTWSGRYVALGRTMSGRYLACIFEKGAQPGVIRIVTARDMNHAERVLYRRKT